MAVVTICSDSGAQENKVCHCFHFPPSVCHEVMGPNAMIFIFWRLNFKPAFSLSSFTFIKKLFSSSSLSAISVVSSAYLRLLILLPAILIPAYASRFIHRQVVHNHKTTIYLSNTFDYKIAVRSCLYMLVPHYGLEIQLNLLILIQKKLSRRGNY